MKIVLSAFSCRPNAGSEPGVGWAWATALARYHQVRVLTHRCSQLAIERYFAEKGRTPGLSFSFYGTEESPYNHGIKALSIQFYYHYWQSQLARWAERDIASFKPDLLHHVTYARYWTPSSLVSVGLPFVFGPVGGGEDPPRPLMSTLSMKGRALECARAGAKVLAERSAAMKTTVRSASIALGTTKASVACLERLGARKAREFASCGMHAQELSELDGSRQPRRSRRHLFIAAGRLIHWKAVDLSIKAMALCRDIDAQLEIFGGGPEKTRLQKLVQRLKLSDRVRFQGAVDRATFLGRLSSATALLHPSLHDSGGFVCLEAMAARVPVICVDTGGPGAFVTPETGFAIPPSEPSVVVQQMAEYMRELAADPQLVGRLGDAGRQRIEEEYLWEKRVERMNGVYDEVMGISANDQRFEGQA
ncbi:MAG: glycosyltransferase family 4 protein [Myxococcales bacterium]|nr:glycosyltransferase family 4 protein [Myxococcales bacterium]